MKKAIAIFLALCMCVSLCACIQKIQHSETKETTPAGKTNSINSIYIDSDDISKYLSIKLTPYTAADSNNKDKYFVKVEVYPIRAGSFSNTDITLKLTSPHSWCRTEVTGANFESYDNNGNHYCLVKFTLPSNGYFEFEAQFFDESLSSVGVDPKETQCTFYKASGRYTPAS